MVVGGIGRTSDVIPDLKRFGQSGGFPEVKSGHNLDDKFPNGALLLSSSLLQEGLLIKADSDDPLVADDHDLAQMLLHFGGFRSPVQIFRHPFLEWSHWAGRNRLSWFLCGGGSFVGIRSHDRPSRRTV